MSTNSPRSAPSARSPQAIADALHKLLHFNAHGFRQSRYLTRERAAKTYFVRGGSIKTDRVRSRTPMHPRGLGGILADLLQLGGKRVPVRRMMATPSSLWWGSDG